MKGISQKINEISKVLKQNKYQEFILKIVATLTIVCTTVYGVNELLFKIYDTILGNVFLIFIIIVIGLNDIWLGIFTIILFIILYIYYKNNMNNKNKTLKLKVKEGFEWSQNDIDNFLEVQQTASPTNIYDIQTLQKYVSQEELNDYLKNKKWTWSTETQTRYQNALDTNPYVRIYKSDGLNQAQKVYNEYAINYILDNQEEIKKNNEKDKTNPKPKPWLPSGWGSFGYNSGLL